MTSKNKSIFKILLVLVTAVVGIGVSAFTTVKQNQTIKGTYPQQSHIQKRLVNISTLDRKMQKELSMLVPGTKRFNSRFLNKTLTNKSDHKEG